MTERKQFLHGIYGESVQAGMQIFEPQEILYGFRGEHAHYLYDVADCSGTDLVDILNEIRILMVRNHERPFLIHRVTDEYLRQRKLCGLPTQ